jgi:hypothetical protein
MRRLKKLLSLMAHPTLKQAADIDKPFWRQVAAALL